MLRLRLVALGACFALFVSHAAASPPFELIGSNLGNGGFNARAYGASAASAYFNPALLPQADAGLSLGTFVLNDAISITLDARDPAVDVPLAALDNFNAGDRSVGTLPAEPTRWLQSGCQNAPDGCVSNLAPRPRQGTGSSGNVNAYGVVGMVGHLWRRYLSLGLYTLIPIGDYVRNHAFFVDEREQHFTNSLHQELYSDRLTSLSFAFGLGSRVNEHVSLGLGASLSLSNNATAATYIGDSSRLGDTLLLSPTVRVVASVSPHFSLQAAPIDGLSLSATVHAPEKLDTTTTTISLLANGDRQIVERVAIQAWQPWILGLGGAWVFHRERAYEIAVTGTITYQLWSQYLNRQGEHPQKNYEWRDVPSFALGVRYTHNKNLAAMLDGTVQVSPVPLQSGRTNYVDNDRFGINGGVTYELPIETWGAKLRLGCQAQLHLLRARHQSKINPKAPQLAAAHYSQLVEDEWSDHAINGRGNIIPEAAGLQTNNPGWPGFSSSGFLIGAGLTASLIY